MTSQTVVSTELLSESRTIAVSGTRRRFFILLALAIAFTIPSALAISGESLWVDEAISAFFAAHARLLHLDRFGQISGITNMPLYHIVLTMWVSVWGDSERALRSLNLPFAFLFVASIAFLCVRSRTRDRYIVAGLFSVFPLLIYYANDARPYAALLGLSAAATVSFLTFIERPTRSAAWLCIFFSLAAVAMHLFGMLCPLSLLIFICLRRDVRQDVLAAWRLWIAPVALSAIALLVCLLVYLKGRGIISKVSVAPGYPDIPINVTASWKNVVFTAYGSFGFGGLGPPRNDLRVHASLHTFLPYLGWMAVGIVACGLLGALLVRSQASPQIKNARSLLLASGLSLFLFFLAARFMHFGFLERHAISLAGVVCCAIALLLLNSDTKLQRVALAVTLVAWTISSARLVSVYSYGKDDLRTAIQVAKETSLPILWNMGVQDPDPGYYDAGDTADNNLQFEWFKSPPLRSQQHWKLVTTFHRLSNGPQTYVDEVASKLAPGKYVLVKGKADLADPAGRWARKFSEWNPRLLNHLNGYDVFLVDVPSASGPSALSSTVATR